MTVLMATLTPQQEEQMKAAMLIMEKEGLDEGMEAMRKIQLTPEQEAMLDEHGDWIVTPENRKPSFMAQKTTSDTLSTQHIIPQSDEWHWLLPLFYSRSRPEKPSDTKSWLTTLSTRLRQWISLHF